MRALIQTPITVGGGGLVCTCGFFALAWVGTRAAAIEWRAEKLAYATELQRALTMDKDAIDEAWCRLANAERRLADALAGPR